MKTYTIDAKNKILGRLASDAAAMLRGKNEVNFAPNVVPDIEVVVTNVSQVKLSGDKLGQKEYQNYSGYPGGLKVTSIKRILQDDKKGMALVFKKAVWGMLPKNKLRKEYIKNLTIKNGEI